MLNPVQAAGLRRLVRVSADSVRGRVIVVDGRGRLLADSAGARPGRSYADRPEVRRALRGHSEQITRNSETLGTEILATAVPVLEHGRPTARCGSPRASPPSTGRCGPRSSTSRRWPASCCCSGSPGAVVAQQIARPIRRLDRAARQVAGGDLDSTVAVEGSTEQRSLARAPSTR